jgi:hypothetical protein
MDPVVAIFDREPKMTFPIATFTNDDYKRCQEGQPEGRAENPLGTAGKSKAFWRGKHEVNSEVISVVFKPDRPPGLVAVNIKGVQRCQVSMKVLGKEEGVELMTSIAKKYQKGKLVATELFDERDKMLTAMGKETPPRSTRAASLSKAKGKAKAKATAKATARAASKVASKVAGGPKKKPAAAANGQVLEDEHTEEESEEEESEEEQADRDEEVDASSSSDGYSSSSSNG